MKLFACQRCASILYFENTKCEKCEAALGFDANSLEIVALQPETAVPAGSAGATDTTAYVDFNGGRGWRFCANAAHGACNWLLPEGSNETLCYACRHNGTIPDLSITECLVMWRRVELAKHRLFYSILSLGLPTGRNAENRNKLIFDVLADDPASGRPAVLTGHDGGRITLALAEADDVERERRRALLGEPYRTLLGHFRHEIGHYYWDMLVDAKPALDGFRDLFGDEREDYNAALQSYYASGAPADWFLSHVSAYACAHPWEDFAETFAHYLHIVDTLEMAANFGVRLRPTVDSPDRQDLAATLTPAALETQAFDDIISNWLPITYMSNNLNRCMGSNDLYPFLLTPKACEKLKFVHELISNSRPD